jgi:hypothetical protein
MDIVSLISQEHLRGLNSAASVTLSVASALILIGMHCIHHLELPLTFAFFLRSHLMASTGNNGTVQLWQDSEKLDDGSCQCDCSFFCPLSSLTLLTVDKYPMAPHDVAYRERDSLMAVACMNGHVSI